MKRILLVLALALASLVQTGCGTDEMDIVGSWEGRAGTSDLAFDFRPDGNAVIRVTVDSETSTTRCAWSVLNGRICITNDRGQVRWFPIVGSDADSLTLRVQSGSAGICELRRIRK